MVQKQQNVRKDEKMSKNAPSHNGNKIVSKERAR